MTSGRDIPNPMLTTRRTWLAGVVAGVAPVGCGRTIATASSSVQPTASPLAPLLERNRSLRPDFGGGFANHQSMGLYSLSALGGGSEELIRFADAHWAVLEPMPIASGPRVTRKDWQSRLGQYDAIDGFRQFFERELAELGRKEALRRYLPGLLPGISAAGFHGLIRTGYGVRFGDDHEICDGLAYWATAFSSLGRPGSGGGTADPWGLYEKISLQPHLGQARLRGRLIVDKQRAASELPGFDEVANALQTTEGTLARIAALSVQLYIRDAAHTGDLTTLHAVTGGHAYRMLEPFIEPREEGLRYFWRALVATYISAGATPLVEPSASEAPAWAESAAHARASLDEHDVKLVDTAREEESFYGDSSYRLAAARRMHLI